MKKLHLAFITLALPLLLQAAPDPNFHIYIAYGQSNMAGAGAIRSGTDDIEHSRYKMFATTECSQLGRYNVGELYPAKPPMFHCNEGLSVADWFGRYLADSLPGITIGVIPVAVGGTKIELFDKDKYTAFLNSLKLPDDQYLIDWAKDYGSDGNAHARIVEVAKEAQKVGVIKGIIFHQGESGSMEGNDWRAEVKKTRDDILEALGLSADTVPFLAGELEDEAAGGCCGWASKNLVDKLPEVMDNTYIVSSAGLTGNGIDQFHFSSESYQEFGRRYAEEMLKHIKLEPVEVTPQLPFNATNTPWTIPGKIEAEDFDIPGTGSDGNSYNDSDPDNNQGKSTYRDGIGVDIKDLASGGHAIGWNANNDWLEYTINVSETGNYTLYAAVSGEGGRMVFSLDGNQIGDTIKVSTDNATEGDTVSEEAYSDFYKVKTNVRLESGVHVLRMTVAKEWFDLDYINFVKGENAPDDSPIGGTDESSSSTAQNPSSSSTQPANSSAKTPDSSAGSASDNEGNDISDDNTETIIGIAEPGLSADQKVYKLYTLRGELLRQSKGAQVSTKGLNKGIYLLQEQNGTSKTAKMVQIR